MLFGPLGPSLAPYVRSSRTLRGWVTPIAKWYANLTGYRRMGLVYDDLLVEERPDVQKALSRLTPRQEFDRAYRIKRAAQQSILHKDLDSPDWIKPEEDIRYLKPHVQAVEAEDNERRTWDTIQVERRK
ncbi:hypothetical protein EVG20_g1264 [Dentipellis fragilis]|uniref:Cytochrome b-c1 complex subunit 7 n=1 Tax=Dentipellis fragilis TaxID=205917 RepID=A0A4Y9ZD24_9AGAM|nr:hypothetical protein EVG20_g1264 [Dentipellis fragilis]